ncbi:TetR family transcriptional regulator [Chitinimonas sp. BJB300]|uniref:TetR family transcriptional regulator n=1 Tax=Chitinimonas sp. BJB300 TaxID=1559339 RepID=UPI000C1100BC|nr:TetR family transcriptional regulator [Chitinimonas sp. BJB300]PHV12063.1 TetR family transcriptional regulator [Chitinimonas sp. BJB300]TSJ87332.1 TetR family transcriptional regulator [Chitinimonas sp. BJB300]
MARKTKEQAAETREQLLDAAERVFHDKGVSRATLDDIARDAGMTRGAIYWHFKNKTAIFSAMCERATLPMQAMLDAQLADPTDDPLGQMTRDGARILSRVANDPSTMRVFEILLFKTELSEVVAEVMAEEAERAAACRQQLAAILRAAQLKGQIPAHVDCYLAAFALNGFLVGCIREWLELREFDLAERAEWLMRTFYAGLQHAPVDKKGPLELV